MQMYFIFKTITLYFLCITQILTGLICHTHADCPGWLDGLSATHCCPFGCCNWPQYAEFANFCIANSDCPGKYALPNQTYCCTERCCTLSAYLLRSCSNHTDCPKENNNIDEIYCCNDGCCSYSPDNFDAKSIT